MATHSLGTDHADLLAYPTDVSTSRDVDAEIGLDREVGNTFRGFFFAMLLSLFLALLCTSMWELWRRIR